MKNFFTLLNLILIAVIVIVVITMGILTWQKSRHDKFVAKAKNQVEIYNKYEPDNKEYHKVKRSEKNDLYYYAADNKRYIFPTIEVYRSWYGNFIIDNLAIEDLNKLYETELGGNVTFRPGTLIKSPTLTPIFIAVKNGTIRPFSDENIVKEIYGSDWQKYVSELADYYFSQYQIGEPIKSVRDFPEIPQPANINQDKGLE